MTNWSVKHKSILALLSVVLFACGVFSYIFLERQENPAIASPAVTVKCIYPGASPEDVEKQVIKPLETELGELSEIKTLTTYSIDSAGIVQVMFKDMSDSDIEKAQDKVREKVDDAKVLLPSTANEPEIETDFTSAYGFIIGLSSDEYNYKDIERSAKYLQGMLEKDEGVKVVDLDGEIGRQIEIALDMTKLSEYGIAPNTMAAALKARNVNVPGGNIEMGGAKVPVQISGEYRSVDEIGGTIVSISSNGTPIYLRDLAEIYETDKKKESSVYINGQKGMLVGVKFMDGVNILKVEKRLQNIVSYYRENKLYADMDMTEVYNQAFFVNDSIDLFASNLVSAIALVLIVVLLTMGLRSAVVVVLSIPLVICMVFAYMYIMKIPLHQVSIASLIICLSLLVANGIVANDNMNLYLDNGHDRMTACTKGVDEVKIPILTSTLTTIASFLPLAMMQGSAGKFVHSLPVLVTVALLGSFITSLTVVPAVGYVLLKPKGERSKNVVNEFKMKLSKSLKVDKVVHGNAEIYKKALRGCLNRPALSLLICLIAFAATMSIVPTMDIQLFPPVEREQYVINITAQDNSTIEKTEQVCSEVSKILEKEESINNFSYKIGDGFMKYYVTFFPNEMASNKAQFLINGTRSEAENVERRIKEQVPNVSTTIKYLEINLPADYPIMIRISGDDINTLRSTADEVKEVVRNVEGVKSIEDNYGLNNYKLHVNVNEEKASMAGITTYEIESTVRMVVNGVDISELKQKNIDDDSLPIVAKVADKDKTNRDILDTIFITSSITGRNTPLNQIADIETQSSMGKIIRRNSERTITVGIMVKEGYNTNRVLRNCQEAMTDFVPPEGYSIEYGGENENSHDAFSSMIVPSGIAVVLIYIIMVFQFGDLRKPLIIMATIPLSFIGIILGLKAMGYPIGFMALLGAISLMGVVVNNGIVLLDYITIMSENKNDFSFEEFKDIVADSSKTRFRPIMTGMVTTVISLIPLMISGGTLWAPMATSIVTGMLFSSFLTLIAVPCGYILLFKRRKTVKASKDSDNSVTA